MVDWNNPKDKVSKFFTVGEVTQNDKRRIPKSKAVQESIVRLAKELDKVREAYGKPIGVTSWYRPPDVNREVGGVSNSQHIQGSAADVYPIGGDINHFQKWVDSFWGDKAVGYGAKKGFVHLDLRTGRKRWNY